MSDLSREFRADLAWWNTFISPWNGVGLLHHLEAEPDYEFTSDASSTWGCGAGIEISGSSFAWNAISQSWDTSTKELFPILVATAVWGTHWVGSSVLCHWTIRQWLQC